MAERHIGWRTTASKLVLVAGLAALLYGLSAMLRVPFLGPQGPWGALAFGFGPILAALCVSFLNRTGLDAAWSSLLGFSTFLFYLPTALFATVYSIGTKPSAATGDLGGIADGAFGLTLLLGGTVLSVLPFLLCIRMIDGRIT